MSTAGTPDPLLRWAEQLADGKRTDDEDLDALDPALREGLKQIEALAQGFGSLLATPESPQLLAPGMLFGPLSIIEVLGRGGFGTVYRAHDPALDRVVALKVPAESGRLREDLLREGQLMARIDHPNVLKVHGVISHGQQLGFACELMGGESMQEWANRQGQLSARELVAIGCELAAALSALHREAVVHGDLKPANVLRHEDGRWVLADFGSGQLAWSQSSASGTPAYMALERLQGQAPSAASDQYSLGVLLFRLASGRYPVEADTQEQLAARQQAGARLRLLDLRPDLSPQLIAVIERALENQPGARFASMGEFSAALLRAGPDQAASAPAELAPQQRVAPGSILAGGVRWSRLLAGVAALALLLVYGVWQHASVTTLPELNWLRAGAGGDETLPAGAAIRPGEALALELNLQRPQHVYVVNEDSQGARFQLFPVAESELMNPLPSGRIRLPGNAEGQVLNWNVTSQGGRERFYVLLSSHALPGLEVGLAEQASRSRTGDELAALGTERGVGGLSPQASAETGTESAWLVALRREHPQLRVQQFELSNP